MWLPGLEICWAEWRRLGNATGNKAAPFYKLIFTLWDWSSLSKVAPQLEQHGWRALLSFLHSDMQCLAWLLSLDARFRTSSAVIKWCAKNGEMSLKTFQSSDSIARTSSCCQTCFQNENWSPAQQGNVRPPTFTRKKKGKCLVHNPSFSAYTETQPEAVTQGVNFLETVGNGKHLAQLPCFNPLSFPLCLADNRQVFHPWP